MGVPDLPNTKRWVSPTCPPPRDGCPRLATAKRWVSPICPQEMGVPDLPLSPANVRALSSNASSLLACFGVAYFGSTTWFFRYLRMVFRDNPLRLQISRIGSPSRNRHLRITLNNATSITPLSPARVAGRSVSSRGSNFDANIGLRWVSFQCKSTAT